jgi:hypothetical protein
MGELLVVAATAMLCGTTKHTARSAAIRVICEEIRRIGVKGGEEQRE